MRKSLLYLNQESILFRIAASSSLLIFFSCFGVLLQISQLVTLACKREGEIQGKNICNKPDGAG